MSSTSFWKAIDLRQGKGSCMTARMVVAETASNFRTSCFLPFVRKATNDGSQFSYDLS